MLPTNEMCFNQTLTASKLKKKKVVLAHWTVFAFHLLIGGNSVAVVRSPFFTFKKTRVKMKETPLQEQ